MTRNADYWAKRTAEKKANRQLLCSVQLCGKNRADISPYCWAHLRRDKLYGSPYRGPDPYDQWADIEKRTRALLSANSTHAAVIAIERLIRHRLHAAPLEDPNRIAGCPIWSRLHEKEVSAWAVLTRLVCVAHVRLHDEGYWPTDLEYRIAIGNAVMALAPRVYRHKVDAEGRKVGAHQGARIPPRKHRLSVADWCVHHIMPVAFRLAEALDRAKMEAQLWVRSAAREFELPSEPKILLEAAGMLNDATDALTMRLAERRQANPRAAPSKEEERLG
jgi:hypothetical protein